MSDDRIVDSVRRWIETLVVGLDLCPFARRELVAGRVRLTVTRATTEDELLLALQRELELLDADPELETTLLIHPDVLQTFSAYNQFLDAGDALLRICEREGVYQIAGFHPEFQFAGAGPDDPENYSNRAPYPLLHLLREDSVARAVAEHPDVSRIPERNIQRLNGLGSAQLQTLCHGCCPD